MNSTNDAMSPIEAISRAFPSRKPMLAGGVEVLKQMADDLILLYPEDFVRWLPTVMIAILQNLENDATHQAIGLLVWDLAYAMPRLPASKDPYWRNAVDMVRADRSAAYKQLDHAQSAAVVRFLKAVEPFIESYERDVYEFACEWWAQVQREEAGE